MARITYEKFLTPRGVLRYPHLTEADTKFDSNGVYHTKLILEADEASELIDQLEGIRDTFKADKLPDLKPIDRKKAFTAEVFEEELDDEGAETGRVIFAAKLKAHVVTKTGKEWDQAPRLFDASLDAVEPEGLKLWGGSEVKISGEVVPYYMASAKTFGVSLRMRAVQILSLAAAGGDASDFGFGEEDGFTAPEKAAGTGFSAESNDNEEDEDEF